jgi:hypothetical protein
MLVDVSHIRDLLHLILFTVLNNTKGIYPEIFVSQRPSDKDSIMEKFREFARRQCLLMVWKRFYGCFEQLVLPPTVTQSNPFLYIIYRNVEEGGLGTV